MVISLTKDGVTFYTHLAWANDAEGTTDFTLTEDEDAEYIGRYTDTNSGENSSPTKYTWTLQGDPEDGETDYSEEIEGLTEWIEDVEASAIENDANIQIAQNQSDLGIGIPNELAGTNSGVDGWTVSSNITAAAFTARIYRNQANDEVEGVTFTADTAGGYAYYDAENLRAVVAAGSEGDSYTFSADMCMSSNFEVPTVSLMDTDGTNAQLVFDSVDLDPVDTEVEDTDGTWVHVTSTVSVETSNDEPVAESAQVLYLDLQNMAAGDTLSVANLKVEAGALETPWRRGVDEVESIAVEAKATAVSANTTATTAYTLAEDTNAHFWSDSSGAHITQVDQETYISDPASAGGNTLITTQGFAVRDGTTQLAAFTGSGATIGISDGTEAYMTLDYHSMQMVDKNGNVYAEMQDLRDDTGYATITETFYGAGDSDGTYSSYKLAVIPSPTTSLEVEVNGTTSTAWGLANAYITFTYELSDSDVVKATYTTSSASAKSYTFGLRQSGADIGMLSFAEGRNTAASGFGSHCEGDATCASGKYAHAEGGLSGAAGDYSHAENAGAAYGYSSHAEGGGTVGNSGDYAHAEGSRTYANASAAHAEGVGTVALSSGQSVQGHFNIVDSNNTYAAIIGNGSDDNNRSNALTVDWAGNVVASGDVEDGNGNVLAEKQETLVSGTNIKTVNGNSLLGSGDVAITGGVTDVQSNGASVVTDGVADIGVDYVIEQVTSGKWTYRKWNSGVVECWYRGTSATTSLTSATGGGYQANFDTLTFPVTYTAIPMIWLQAARNSTDNGFFSCYAKNISTTGCNVNIARHFSANNMSIGIDAYVKGYI